MKPTLLLSTILAFSALSAHALNDTIRVNNWQDNRQFHLPTIPSQVVQFNNSLNDSLSIQVEMTKQYASYIIQLTGHPTIKILFHLTCPGECIISKHYDNNEIALYTPSTSKQQTIWPKAYVTALQQLSFKNKLEIALYNLFNGVSYNDLNNARRQLTKSINIESPFNLTTNCNKTSTSNPKHQNKYFSFFAKVKKEAKDNEGYNKWQRKTTAPHLAIGWLWSNDMMNNYRTTARHSFDLHLDITGVRWTHNRERLGVEVGYRFFSLNKRNRNTQFIKDDNQHIDIAPADPNLRRSYIRQHSNYLKTFYGHRWGKNWYTSVGILEHFNWRTKLRNRSKANNTTHITNINNVHSNRFSTEMVFNIQYKKCIGAYVSYTPTKLLRHSTEGSFMQNVGIGFSFGF